MRVAQTLLLPLVLAALWSPGVDAHEAAAASCIDTDDIEACMESLGFGCSRRPSPQTSIGAFELRCSIPLPDGRTYAVQLLNDTNAWSIGREHSYHPESAPHNLEPLRDSNSILNTYIHEQMGNMTLQYSGAQETPRRVQIQFEVRSGSSGESVGVMALCGTVLAEEPDDWLENHLIQSCEPLLQRVIVRLAHQDNSGPYRVFGMNDISWIRSNATVGQDIDALLVEGRYLFPPVTSLVGSSRTAARGTDRPTSSPAASRPRKSGTRSRPVWTMACKFETRDFGSAYASRTFALAANFRPTDRACATEV